MANLDVDHGDDDDDGGGNRTGQMLPHQHRSSTVARDSGARVEPPARLEPEAAASLVQSRFRGYRTRKGFVGGGLARGGCEPTVGGKGAARGGGKWQEGMEAEEVDGGAGGSGGGGGGTGKCSLLDLEVRIVVVARQSTAQH